MLKRVITAFFLLITAYAFSQGGTTSPYSFFGIGTLKFKGTVENRSMGGIGIYSDSIHLNIQNPAGVSGLKLVNYSIAGSHKYNTLSTSVDEEKVTTTTLEYLAIGVPMGKFGASFGLIPYTSSGYKLQNIAEGITTKYSGSGGMNKAFLMLGYQITPNLSIGVDANYNFGSIENTGVTFQEGIQLGTEEVNRSEILGFSFNFGAQYHMPITDKLDWWASVTYTPETGFDSENSRTLTTVLQLPNGTLFDVDARDIEVANTDFTYPSQFTIGSGIGENKKWFFGAEFSTQKTSNFTNGTFELENVIFEDASKFRFGGFFIPNYNSFGSFWKRVVYRGGFRFEETGVNVNGEPINEFGISFGLGMALQRSFSNLNLGFEFGNRGTETNGLVKETFFNIYVGLSLNDKWFEKRLYD